MRCLLDTDTCIWVLRGREPVYSWIPGSSPDDLAVASMTEAELRHGAPRGREPAWNMALVEALMAAPLVVLTFDRETARVHADLRLQLNRQPIDEQDLIIAIRPPRARTVRTRGPHSSKDEVIRRLRREVARLTEEREISKTQRPSSPGSHGNASFPLHPGPRVRVCRHDSVPGARGVEGWLLRVGYAWLKRPPSAGSREDAALLTTIRDIHQESGRTCGSPRVHRGLRGQGLRHGEKHIARVTRVHGIRAGRSAASG